MRSGLIVKKIGMTRFYNEKGEYIPVTLLSVEEAQVISHLTLEKNGYTAIQIGVGVLKKRNIKKPLQGHFNKFSIEFKKKISEFRISPENFLDIGDRITAEHFLIGQKVDVTGISIGKGFSGVMKRHNFSGHRASHGNSVTHRSHGSTGQRQDPGKVFKGKKMAGRMGNVRVTIQNLEVVSINIDSDLIIVRGSVPGPQGSWLLIRDARKNISSTRLNKNLNFHESTTSIKKVSSV